jgi:hypothetical protein
MHEQANRFDIDLFRLISMARDLKENEPKWGKIADKLGDARSHVRSLMHEDDVKATQ